MSMYLSVYLLKNMLVGSSFWQIWKNATVNIHIVEGNGTPLQYSCLENPMDGGAWWAAVHGVAKSRTWLSDFTLTFHFHALEKEMATHSNVLAWRIPGMGEPGGLPSMGSHRVGHDWSNVAAGNYFSSFSLLLIKFTALFTWPVCPCEHLSCFVCPTFPFAFFTYTINF